MKTRQLQFSFRTLLFIVMPLVSLIVVWIVRKQTADQAVEILRLVNDRSLIASESEFEFNETEIWNDSFWGRKPLHEVTDIKMGLWDENVSAVSRLPAVKKLELRVFQTKHDWKRIDELLDRLGSVEWVVLHSTVNDWSDREGVNNVDKVYSRIAQLRNLKRLTLHGVQLKFETAREFRKIKLETLEIAGQESFPFKAINGLGSLKTLRAPNARVTDYDIANLTFNKNLEVLELEGNAIQGFARNAFKGFSKMRSLRRLNLSHNPLGVTESRTGGLELFNEAMATLPKLESLDLSHTGVGDQTIEVLYKKLPLKVVDFSNTKVTDAGLANLVKKFPMLEEVHVENSQVTEEGLKVLGELKHLKASD